MDYFAFCVCYITDTESRMIFDIKVLSLWNIEALHSTRYQAFSSWNITFSLWDIMICIIDNYKSIISWSALAMKCKIHLPYVKFQCQWPLWQMSTSQLVIDNRLQINKKKIISTATRIYILVPRKYKRWVKENTIRVSKSDMAGK